jgi:SAM-dependent methyltransferase
VAAPDFGGFLEDDRGMHDPAYDPVGHRADTRDAYDRLAGVWSATTDDGPYNGGLERPALRALVPQPLTGRVVLDAGCGSGAQCEWLIGQGAEPIGVDLSPRMVDEAARRCRGHGRFFVADLGQPLAVDAGSCDGITCSLALHYLRDWTVPLQSFATALRPGGWVVISLDHPFAPPLRSQEGGYFDTELVSDTWRKGDVEVTQRFWRRPLAACIEAFADAGFVVERIAEARPSAEALRRWPAELAGTVAAPSFIVYRLRLTAHE